MTRIPHLRLRLVRKEKLMIVRRGPIQKEILKQKNQQIKSGKMKTRNSNKKKLKMQKELVKKR